MHSTYVKLNFPTIKMRARRSERGITIWDRIRRGFIVLTPEEWVRQHLIEFLASHFGLSETQIILEYPVLLNGQNQRADVVVVGRGGVVQLLVECKAPDVAISQSTLDQAVRYNSVAGARYIILTNGLTHHIYRRTDEQGGVEALAGFDSIELE